MMVSAAGAVEIGYPPPTSHPHQDGFLFTSIGGLKDDEEIHRCRRRRQLLPASLGPSDRDEKGIRRRLLEQLLASFDPSREDPELRERLYPTPTPGNKTRPPPPRCHLFRIKLSGKNAQASWLLKEFPRFYPDVAGSVPFRIARLAADGSLRLEQAVDGGEPGVLSLCRIRPWPPNEEEVDVADDARARARARAREVAVIGRSPGAAAGLALSSTVRKLGVRLHDKLFLLPWPGCTVILTFSDRRFHVPSRWTGEKLYAADDLNFIDITGTVEKLTGNLYQMYQQEEGERKIVEKQQEEEKKREELEMEPLDCIPLGWGDVKWESPDQAMHRRFRLSVDTNGEEVCADFVEQEGPRDMRRRLACNGRFVLPLTTSALQVVGFVEGYLDPDIDGFIEEGEETKKLRPVVMVSLSTQEHAQEVNILSFKFLVDRLAIRLNDRAVLTGWKGISVDIHCGHDDSDVFLSCISAVNWTQQILEWKVDCDNPIPSSCLLMQLKRKLCHLSAALTAREEHELGLSSIFAVESEEDQGLVYDPRQQENIDLTLDTLSISGSQLVGDEGESDYSLLFNSPGESDWVKVSEPYVPKFPTEEEILEREARRKEQLKKVMEPMIRPVCEPRRDWNFFMDEPETIVTQEAEIPMHEPFSECNYWTLSDKSESKLQPKSKLYPRLACLEWCTCSTSTMLQVYALEIIVADSLYSCKFDIYGFVAIRDFRDGRRNYIFNREASRPLTVVSHHGVLLLPILSPRRAITINPDILLDCNLKMKRTDGDIDSYSQLIEGVSEHPSSGRCWSRVNELNILPFDYHPIPKMRLKLAMILHGIEATVELRPLRLPSEGIHLRCAARTGWIGDDLVLFDEKCAGAGVDTPLQFVVATELHGNMEIHLEGVFDGVSKRWSIGFVPKFHALFCQVVDFEFAQVSVTVAWSRL